MMTFTMMTFTMMTHSSWSCRALSCSSFKCFLTIEPAKSHLKINQHQPQRLVQDKINILFKIFFNCFLTIEPAKSHLNIINKASRL